MNRAQIIRDYISGVKLRTPQGQTEALAALDSLEEQLEATREALFEMAELAPVGAADIEENHVRQEAHRRAITLLGLPDPGEFVASDYWLRVSIPS